ncbi:MAG TPA: hypothetical protein DEG71_08260 [Clostridiales bacterium]|nr:hypothetical protein [Clostridiales bacterium]
MTQNCNCLKELEIQDLRIKVAVHDSNISEVRNDIKDVRGDIKDIKKTIEDTNQKIDRGNDKVVKLMYWIMGLMGSAILAFIGFSLKK